MLVGGKNPDTNVWYDNILIYDNEAKNFTESLAKMSVPRDGHNALLLPRDTMVLECPEN